jgi:Cu/Ag efflux pump CusA
MLLAGLVVAIGIIVDDAIIDPENIRRRLRRHDGEMNNETKENIIVDAAAEMRNPIVFAILILGELQTIPGVRNIGAHVGRAITGDQISGINSGEIWVSLDPAAEYDATVVSIQEVVGGYPGLFREVENYQPDRIGQVVAGEQDNDIVVRIYGYQYDVLDSVAQDVETALSNVAGVVDIQVEHLDVEPQVEIEVDLAAAERNQLKPGDVRRSTTTLLSGLRVGNLYEEQKVFDVMVWGEPDVRANLSDLENLLIDTPGGGHVRLGEVAEIRISPTPINIKRDAVSRYIDVTANVDGRSYGAVVADIENSFDQIEFPLEYHVELLGDYAGQRASQQRTLIFSAIAVGGIILLLQASFWSWHLALAAFITILASLSGGILTALLAGGEISFGSLFGFLAVLAIAVRYSIVLTRHLQYLEQQEGVEFGPELVVRGAAERLRPTLMTAFAVGFAILPLVVVGPMPGLEILHPMAVVLLGGLVTTTLLSLFVFPPLYLRYGMKTEIIETASPEPATSG